MTRTVIIDNGHGIDTCGKSSPDGRLREWLWTRTAARCLRTALIERGFQAVLLVPEEADVPLGERCRRANALAAANAGSVLISLHCNAAGDGTDWHGARGFCAFVHPEASTGARVLARQLTVQAQAAGFGGNRCMPAAGYWQADYAILRGTQCPAVLTENLFMDNRDDVEVLLSRRGMHGLVAAHVQALLTYESGRTSQL